MTLACPGPATRVRKAIRNPYWRQADLASGAGGAESQEAAPCPEPGQAAPTTQALRSNHAVAMR